MKKTGLLLLFCIILTITFNLCYSNSPNEVIQQVNEGESIKKIREEYKIINSDTSYLIIEKDLEDLSTEGGTLVSYYKKNILKKAVILIYGEMGKKTMEYYYKNGNVIFVFVKEYFYDSPIYDEGFKISYTDDNRYYFHQNKLIKWIDDKRVNRNIYDVKSLQIGTEIINDAVNIINRSNISN